MSENCQDCQKLWGQYVSAALEQIRLDRQVYFTSLGKNAVAIASIKDAFDRATVTMLSMREMIRQHAETHQRSAAASA